MSETNQPYTSFEPGQLITAEGMNAMQAKIRADITDQVAAAIKALTEIDRSGDSDKLGGETAQELLERFLERAMQEFPEHTGYKKLFKVLNFDERNVLKHELQLCPLVDLYELLSFEAVCAVDDDKHRAQVRFFLYHTSEKKIRAPGDGGGSVEIEVTGEPPFRIPLSSMLAMFGVEYTDATSLGDLETEFWTALFAEPNDTFDPDSYCHSPWYERCCREERTVGSLKEKGDWDELWLKIHPRKTVNPPTASFGDDNQTDQTRFPRGVVVEHHDLNTLGLTFKERIVDPNDDSVNLPMCVMVLLKV